MKRMSYHLPFFNFDTKKRILFYICSVKNAVKLRPMPGRKNARQNRVLTEKLRGSSVIESWVESI